jgi:hypothetical protein
VRHSPFPPDGTVYYFRDRDKFYRGTKPEFVAAPASNRLAIKEIKEFSVMIGARMIPQGK